jgi:hypothetical protein
MLNPPSIPESRAVAKAAGMAGMLRTLNEYSTLNELRLESVKASRTWFDEAGARKAGGR